MWDEVHTVDTPMIPGTRLVKVDCPETPSPTLQRRYRSIVGSIGYLVQMTRCDMAFAYDQLSLFLYNPGPVHMTAAERALDTCEALTTKVCHIATLAPRTETF